MKDDSLEDKSHIREFVKSQDLEKIEQYYVDYQSNLEQNKDKLGKNIKNNDYFIGPKPVSMIMNHLQSETLYLTIVLQIKLMDKVSYCILLV